MSQTTQEKVLIEHVRMKSGKPIGEVAAALESRLGTFDPAVLDQLRNGGAPEAVRGRLEGMAGPSGFTLFRTSDYGTLSRLACQTKKAVQYQLGNILVAIQMMQHDVRVSLYAPARLLIYEDEDGKTCVEYDKLSSLFGQFGNANVTEVAATIDRKLEQLLAEAMQ
jgi:uncharacterized protein (DUF302 family)